MNDAMNIFALFLNELNLTDLDKLMSRFEEFHALLLEKNKQLNLFSRSTPDDELWTKHFLDSLVPLKCIDFTGKKVLDFGSGAGLPGIPVKLAVPDCQMILLDSVLKKTMAMHEMVEKLKLTDCDAVWKRLEEYALKNSGFDFILCRAVRLEERYLQPLQKLLAPSGKVIFYKAQDISDIEAYQPQELYRAEFDYGQRVIYSLESAQLKR